MMVMIMVTLFNTAAVIVLEIFRDGGRVRLKPLLLGLVRNPLLQGCAAGLLCYLLQIRLPDFIASPVSSLSSLATTLAMIALGASLVFDELKKNRRTVTAVLLVRLVLLPLIALPAAWVLGLRGVELFLVLMIFGPVSVLLLIAVLLVVVPRIVKENPRRGTIQDGFREFPFLLFKIKTALHGTFPDAFFRRNLLTGTVECVI